MKRKLTIKRKLPNQTGLTTTLFLVGAPPCRALLPGAWVVGWCEGVKYHMSPGRPADFDLHLGKACYPCSR